MLTKDILKTLIDEAEMQAQRQAGTYNLPNGTNVDVSFETMDRVLIILSEKGFYPNSDAMRLDQEMQGLGWEKVDEFPSTGDVFMLALSFVRKRHSEVTHAG